MKARRINRRPRKQANAAAPIVVFLILCSLAAIAFAAFLPRENPVSQSNPPASPSSLQPEQSAPKILPVEAIGKAKDGAGTNVPSPAIPPDDDSERDAWAEFEQAMWQLALKRDRIEKRGMALFKAAIEEHLRKHPSDEKWRDTIWVYSVRDTKRESFTEEDARKLVAENFARARRDFPDK